MSDPTTSPSQNQRLPIIIAGAGPCGLVAALTLQQQGRPFVIIERASRNRLCSNVGSGFDLAPTTLDILQNRLGIPNIDQVFQTYGGFYLSNMDGKQLRSTPMREIDPNYHAMAANRAIMQQCFLDRLLKDCDDAQVDTFLKCGVQVMGYDDEKNEEYVTVQLSDGTSMQAAALLACDGIHSAVRKSMMEKLGVKDELHYCNIDCWWGKMDRAPGSDFDKAFEATQHFPKEGASFLWALGDKQRPGSFMAGPSENTIMWVFCVKAKTSSTPKSNDLTRRGGVALDDHAKQELMDLVKDRGDLIRLAIQDTPASVITKVGLWDRENLHLPFARGRVALLGDAAHPQTPFMGQGVNQAITDAYVCAMRLASLPDSVPQALQAYDSKVRHKDVNGVIRSARSYGNISVSQNRFVCWLFAFVASKMPPSWLWEDMLKGDKPNREFVDKLDKECLGATKQ